MSGVNAAQVQTRNADFNKPLFDNTMISQDQKMGITNAADAYMKNGGGAGNDQLVKQLHELIYGSGLPQELKDQLAGMASYGKPKGQGNMQANPMPSDAKPKKKKKPKGDGIALIEAAAGKNPVDVKIVGERKPQPTIAVDKEPATPASKPKPKPKLAGRKNTMMEY